MRFHLCTQHFRPAFTGLVITAALLALAQSARASVDAAPTISSSSHPIAQSLARGAYFIPNLGQWTDGDVVYGLRTAGLDIAFRPSALTLHVTANAEDTDARDLVVGVTFPGSNLALPEGADPQAARFNYFVGGPSRTSQSNIPSFASVIYHDLYDGIDLHIARASDVGFFKYEFAVAPGADYSEIRIAYSGIDDLCLNPATGDLNINTPFGSLTDRAPLVWQEVDGARHLIPARFVLLDDRTCTVSVQEKPDPTRSLVIDPEVEWMAYLGGSASDSAYGVAVDSAGNALMAGTTNSTDFDARNNAFHYGYADAFILKVSPAGQLLWMTYLGGGGSESCNGIAVDSTGDASVTGSTDSSNFEGRTNSYHFQPFSGDAFVCRVNSAGVLQWMTYLGGTDADVGNAVVVDSAGSACVSGFTNSVDFDSRRNVKHGALGDAFLAKVNSAGALQWMSYVGGSENDYGHALAVDATGNLILAGETGSTDFEGRINGLHNGFGDVDAFVARANASGVVQWMTYVGGSSTEGAFGVALDSAQNALISGLTGSQDFEGRNNSLHGFIDAFAARVGPSGVIQWMTYLGGFNYDYGYGIAADPTGAVLVTGETSANDFEGRQNALHNRDGLPDAFICGVASTGVVQWMMYLGGSVGDTGTSLALDHNGNAFVAGNTNSNDFEDRINTLHVVGPDAFLVKVRTIDPPQLSVAAACPSGGPIDISWTGATPSARAVLIFARNTGSFVIPNGNPCAGTSLGLGANLVQVVFQGNSDASGGRSINSTAGASACGGYLQLLDTSTCLTSNVAVIQ